VNTTNQKQPLNWMDIVKAMDGEAFRQDPNGFLNNRQIHIDSSLSAQIQRLKDFEMQGDRQKMWNALKALAEGKLTSAEQRDVICELAATYRGFIGWEGDFSDEPGW